MPIPDLNESVTVVIPRSAEMPSSTTATTPGLFPNMIIRVMSPLWIVFVRAARVYLQTLLGLLTAGTTGMASNVLPAGDFLHLLTVCAGLSLASAIVCVIQNSIELLTKLDQTAPQLRG